MINVYLGIKISYHLQIKVWNELLNCLTDPPPLPMRYLEDVTVAHVEVKRKQMIA